MGLIVDNFAGGGGASVGIEAAMGRVVDIAINHDAEALAMHEANHPGTRHYREDIWHVDPREVCAGQAVDLAWFSPDCTHFSKAKGKTPVKKDIRALAWIVLKWAAAVRPAVICLENVEEFMQWGPVRRGRPVKSKKGLTFFRWVEQLRDLGYEVDWRELSAHHYGTPTSRKRLVVVARCDGLPIRWPKGTHGPDLIPYRTAAEIIDWSIPCHSIFMSKEEARKLRIKRPLADRTMARIARGIQRFVIDHPDPFIIKVNHGYDAMRGQPIDEPLRTVTGKNGFGLVVPHVSRQFGKGTGHDAREPLAAVMPKGGGKSALVAAFLAQHNGGMTGRGAAKPLSTITGRGTQQAVVSSLLKFKGTCRDGHDLREPVPTILAGGTHLAEVRAFLIKYYRDGGQRQDCRDPIHTLTAKARLGLVTVSGVDYEIVDIGMRMLTPRELFRAQGFPPDYIIDPDFNGRPMTKTAQTRNCGNSVPPPMAEAVVAAQLPIAAPLRRAA